MGDLYNNPPQSRNEAILRATIDGTEYTDPPESRIEDLLLELKEAIEQGGGGGTTVVANPAGEPTDDLNKVQIGSTIYDIPEGAEVEANPTDSASETLTKLKVDNIIYSVPSGGGGGGTSDYTELDNKPEINGVTLAGNKTAAELGLVGAETGKGLSANDFTDELETKLNGIAAGAQVNAIESITLNGSTISPDANKNVALTVITNVVDNLVNYYLKSETYTKTEVDTIAANIKNSRMEVVSSLPTTDIQTNVIYLVPKSSPDTGNGYDEYINLDGTTSGWELIGNTDIDLSGYVTTSDLNTALASYVTSSDLSTTLSSYATTAAAFLTSDTAETTLDDADTFPFYDTSATAKKKGLLSTLKAFLKTYFDTIYSTVTTLAGLSDVNFSNLRDRQIPQYNAATGKWENVGINDTLVPWSSASDDQISRMIEGYYNGNITLEEIKSVWAEGDVREIDISAISASGGSGDTAWSVSESHIAQTLKVQIVAFDTDTLVTPINGKTKALITVDCKRCLVSSTEIYGVNNPERGDMNTPLSNVGGWESCQRRKWCNNGFYDALPTYIKNLIKTVNKLASAGNSSSTILTSQDKVFLYSEVELFGALTYSKSGEGTQYPFFQTPINRYKEPQYTANRDGDIYWERSPFATNNGGFCSVGVNAASANNSNDKNGIAPVFCM